MTMTEGTPDVVAAPDRRTTLLGGFAAALGDTVLVSAVVLALVAAPVLAVRAVIAAASFILETPGRS